MGYSIATPIRGRKDKERMLQFLREHLRPAYQINPGVNRDFDWTFEVSDTLNYDQNALKIRFNYSIAFGFCREYGEALLRWMALRVGSKRRLKGCTEPVPYYRYDGYMPIPVLLRSTWEGRELRAFDYGDLVDEDGFRPPMKPWLHQSDRADGHVERAVMTSAPESALVDLRKDDRVTVTGEGPYRIEACEPSMVTFVEDKLKAGGHSCEVEFGPPVLNLGRQQMRDMLEPEYERESEIIRSELARLSRLWD